jgi:hypothetical protein
MCMVWKENVWGARLLALRMLRRYPRLVCSLHSLFVCLCHRLRELKSRSRRKPAGRGCLSVAHKSRGRSVRRETWSRVPTVSWLVRELTRTRTWTGQGMDTEMRMERAKIKLSTDVSCECLSATPLLSTSRMRVCHAPPHRRPRARLLPGSILTEPSRRCQSWKRTTGHSLKWANPVRGRHHPVRLVCLVRSSRLPRRMYRGACRWRCRRKSWPELSVQRLRLLCKPGSDGC